MIKTNVAAVVLLLFSFTRMRLEAGQAPAEDKSARDSRSEITITLPRPVGSAVTDAPYSGELAVEDGPQNTFRALVFRNSEGKTRVDGLAGYGAITEITDPVAGVSEILDQQNHVAYRVPLQGVTSIMAGGCCPEVVISRQSTEYFLLNSTGKSMPLFGPGAVGAGGNVGGPGMIDGLPAEGYSQIITAPPSGLSLEPVVFNLESWYSPTLKVTLLYKTSDSRDGGTTIRVTNIKPGEPDPSLFQVPAGYRVTEEKSSFTIKYAGP